MKLILLFFVLMTIISCVSEKKQMDSWLGNDKRMLIRSLGPPARTASDGGTGEILIYYSTLFNGYNRTTIYRYKMFYTDDSGKIYYWRTQGEAVPPQQIDMSIYYRR